MELNFESLVTAWPIVPVCGYLSHLKVADAVPQDGSEISVEDIAARTGLDAKLLYRLMRMVTGAGVFKESAGKKFTHSPVSLKMITGGELEFPLFFHAHTITLNSLATLETQLKDPSKTAFEHHHELPLFNYFEKAGLSESFGKHMTTRTKLILPALLKCIEPLLGENVQVFADLGGSVGHFSLALCSCRPNLNAIVLDLPNVAQIGKTEAESGTGFSSQFDEHVRSRVSFIGGDFFKAEDYAAIAHADVFFFKYIFHDWSDERCSIILNNVHAVMKDQARVIICDAVIPQTLNKHNPNYFYDLLMGIYLGAKERTQEEWQKLIPADKFSVSFSDCVDERRQLHYIMLQKK